MTTGECIHGLEIPLCDICYPRTAATAPPASRTRTAPASRPAGRPATRSGSTRPAREAPAPRVDLDGHRVQHVTHLDNLPAILADGALRAGAAPVVDVSSAAARELRASTELPGGGTAADRVAFYLAPDADRWRELRAGAVGPMWTDAARRGRPADYAILVTSVGALGDVVLADGDAAATATRFARVADDRAAASTLLRRLAAMEEALEPGSPGGLRGGEALGGAEVDLDAVGLLVVANEPVRERVRRLLADAGRSIRVAVNPPWFAAD